MCTELEATKDVDDTFNFETLVRFFFKGSKHVRVITRNDSIENG